MEKMKDANEYSFLIERVFWEDEVMLGKLMKDYISRIRAVGLGDIKEYDAIGFLMTPCKD